MNENVTLTPDMLKNRYNYELTVVDTDSIAFVKPDSSPFTEEEQQALIDEINSYMPGIIQYANDGYFHKCIVLKAKNYIMYDGKKIKLKGSSLKSSRLEPALKDMLNNIIEDLIYNDGINLVFIYHQYIKEALNPTDISRWSQKKTITKPILECETNDESRKNERVVYNAVKHTSPQEGDKVYLYPCILSETVETKVSKKGKVKEKIIQEKGLKLASEFNNDHDSMKLVSRVVATIKILANILDMDKFVNYGLVKNRYLLNEL